MQCPKCLHHELTKQSYNSPHICKACGGIWLHVEVGSDLAAISIEPMDPEADLNNHDDKTGLCPAGHGIMIRAKVDIDEPFYLEKCTACGGIWFDKGEWLRIAESNLALSLSNIWSKSWQRKQGKDKGRAYFLELNQKLLGNQIFNSIMALAKALKDHPQKNRAIALLQHEIF